MLSNQNYVHVYIVLNDGEFNEAMTIGLKEYVKEKLESLSSTTSLGKKRKIDLFSLSSCLYLHSLLYSIFGREVCIYISYTLSITYRCLYNYSLHLNTETN